MNRRNFIRSSALGAFITGNAFSHPPIQDSFEHITSFAQKPSKVPVVENADVIVCGGGPAGIAAAISAARKGAKVLLIEVHGFLGGVWTAGMVNNMIDYENKSGLIQEILTELEKTGAQRRANVFDIEAMKLVLEQMCVREKVNLLYQTRAVAVLKNSNNCITHVIVENKSGRQAYKAKAFIDATGEGDLAAQAGCSFSLGHPDSGKMQPMSMIALLGGIQFSQINPLHFVRGNGISDEEAKKQFLSELERAGIVPSYTKPTLFCIRDDHFAMMANHEYSASGINAQEITNATVQARAEIHRIVNALRNLGGVWKNIQLLATSPQIGIREGRRIAGRYTLTANDLMRGARFTDAVCTVTFCVDIHSLDYDQGGAYGNDGVEVQPYDIPLRSLVAKDVDGLILAGRCISGDFYAHASYRVTGNAVPMGEAAGKVAAISALSNRLAHEIGIDEIKDLYGNG